MRKDAIGYLTVIGIVFVILKLVDVIAWSWWWVLMPFWAIPVFWIGAWMFIFACAFIVAVVAGSGK